MRKRIDNLIKYSFILLVFGLASFFFGGVVLDVPQTAFAANNVTISSADELKNYIVNYNSSHSSDNITLTSDINMNNVVVNSTIGTEETPFEGRFDGRGYLISNLNIDVSESSGKNQYAGLFGVTKGAEIRNVGFSGNLSLTTGDCLNAYVGGLIASAENTSVIYSQLSAKVTYNTNFQHNTYFGTLVGSAVDSDISYSIVRSGSFGRWNFERNENKVFVLGGVVGNLSNSKLSFAVVSINFDCIIGSDFTGEIDIGGVVGTVSQGGSTIVNIAMENSYSVSNNATTNLNTSVSVGEIAGKIANPAPVSKNLSYIHYKFNNNVSRFGAMGSYSYTNENNYDFITVSTYNMTGVDYFSNQMWHPLYSGWDFSSVWYVGSGTIYLQSFYGNFQIGISNSLNKNVLNVDSELSSTGYRFGDKVEIKFSFKEISEGDVVIGNMSKYFSLSAVSLNGVEKAKIITTEQNGAVSYRVSGSDLFEIENEGNGFKLIVSTVNQASAGDYNITTSAKTFKAELTSKLFKDNDDLVSDTIPGYVYYAEGTNTSTENLTLSRMSYGQTYRVETRVKSNTPNAFVGWYLVDESGQSVEIGRNRILEFTFGEVEFDGDCEIYAKYKDNACVITFKMDDGVQKVQLYSGRIVVDQSGATEAISKDEQSVKLEIFVSNGYSFNVDQFITELDTYKTDDPTKTICSLVESYKTEDGNTCYQFRLDMTTLQGDFANAFNINIQTKLEDNANNSWIWYVVGGVIGVVVLGLIIFLIIFFKRRNGGYGGGKSNGSYSKKSYKNMYY